MNEGDFSDGGSTHRLGIYCSTNCNFPLVRAGQPVNLSRAASCGHGGVGPRRKSSSGITALLKLIHCKNLASIYFFSPSGEELSKFLRCFSRLTSMQYPNRNMHCFVTKLLNVCIGIYQLRTQVPCVLCSRSTL